MENETQLTELMVVDGLMVAEIIKSKLENFEIPCMLKFEAVGRLLGITSDGLGKVQVMVPPDYLEKAKEILNTETDDQQAQEDSGQ
ncbi:MAG: DUF2007 domain-containing protein [Candidatus Aminicenantes bacterium]|jgi:hypothetical protein